MSWGCVSYLSIIDVEIFQDLQKLRTNIVVGFHSVYCECVLFSVVNEEADVVQRLNRVKPCKKLEQKCREK